MTNVGDNRLHLEHHSQRFAQKLFRRFPAWKPYLGYDERMEDGLLVHYLDVRVPSQNPKVPEPLRILTRSREVMISWWGGWHIHISPERADRGQETYFQAALDFLDDFTSDAYITATYYRDGKSTLNGFSYYANDHQALEWCFDPKFGQVVLRSWLGGHDREVN